jgi:signal transduction histidine kinase
MAPEPAMEDAVFCAPENGARYATACADSLARFAGGVAHDFNNLLTVINGYSEFILSGRGDPGCYIDYVGEILHAGKKAADIVKMILLYSGHSPQSVEIFDLNGLLDYFRGPFVRGLGDGITVNLDPCGEPLLLRAERSRIHWALVQLVTNAKESMPNGGRIDVATRHLPRGGEGCCRMGADRPRIEISVKDNGRGMSKAEIEHIFEPYYTTKKYSGTPGLGLGLACVQGIMLQSGGCIKAESEMGAGSVFRLCLPLAERN